MIPKKFYPYLSDKLIRLGNMSDGGYVLPKNIAKRCCQCLSFGLGDDLSFEKNLKKLNCTIKVFSYDHTVNNIFWIKHFFYWLWKSLRYRKYLKFFLFIDYYLFYKLEDNAHYKQRVADKQNSLIKIIKRHNIIPKKTILKIDIDGDEYKLLDQIYKFDFACVIIEFENFHSKFNVVSNFLKKSNLKIIHIHGNNFSKVINGIPTSIEITFVNKKYINKRKINTKKYPIKNLDYPNNIMKKDINLIFFK